MRNLKPMPLSATDIKATYPPLDVLKPVAENLWIVDSGPLRRLGVPLPIRMTVARLDTGEIWLHSPTRFTPVLHAALERLGPVRHLVAPNSAHWMFLQDWQKHCPEALVWAAPGLRDRGTVRRAGLRLDTDLSDTAPEAWEGEIAQKVVSGGLGFREVAFLHCPSRTLLLTDLVLISRSEQAACFRTASAAPDGDCGPGWPRSGLSSCCGETEPA